MTDLLLAGALVVLIASAALLGATEAALLRVSSVRIEVQASGGDRRAKVLRSLLEDLPGTLNTVLLMVLLVQISAATIAGLFAERVFGDVGATLAAVVLTLVLFVYGEAIPKTFAVRRPDMVARATAPFLRAAVWLLRPVVGGLVWIADRQAPGVGIASPATITEDELRHLVSEAASAGELEPTDRLLIERVLEFGDTVAADVMVPRTDVVWVEASTPAADALDRALAAGHRRLPVAVTSLDDAFGVARLERLVSARPDAEVRSIADPMLVVPESRRIVDVLREMQRTGRHLAIVVDEHGGAEGILTIEDIAAEVLGRVSDEGEGLPAAIAEIGPDRWRIDAGVDVDEVAETTGVPLPEGPWRTIGGLVLGMAGEVPDVGTRFDIDGVCIEVVDADPRRIRAVEVERTG